MGNFAKTSISKAINKQYSNRVILYLESKEDYDVFKERWYKDWGEWIDFKAVDTPKGGDGGSSQVYRQVEYDRENNTPAFGIVDRDAFLNDFIFPDQMDQISFFESDHSVFDNIQVLENHIKVLRRWEIENYLLHPDAIAKLIESCENNEGKCASNQASQCLLDFSDTAILLSAAILVLMKEKEKAFTDNFGRDATNNVERKKIIIEYLEKRDIKNIEDKLKEMIKRIHTFQREESCSEEARWNQLNHLINGKVFLTQFCHWLGFKDPRRLELAGRIRDDKLIDPEIQEFMDSLQSKAKLLS
ncbi:MAG: DUF4435 domain-containing protein [Magnetococcales bacterium]|nr:DUF4435 domain-containing protein [Magnetococcales bacterium]